MHKVAVREPAVVACATEIAGGQIDRNRAEHEPLKLASEELLGGMRGGEWPVS